VWLDAEVERFQAVVTKDCDKLKPAGFGSLAAYLHCRENGVGEIAEVRMLICAGSSPLNLHEDTSHLKGGTEDYRTSVIHFAYANSASKLFDCASQDPGRFNPDVFRPGRITSGYWSKASEVDDPITDGKQQYILLQTHTGYFLVDKFAKKGEKLMRVVTDGVSADDAVVGGGTVSQTVVKGFMDARYEALEADKGWAAEDKAVRIKAYRPGKGVSRKQAQDIGERRIASKKSSKIHREKKKKRNSSSKRLRERRRKWIRMRGRGEMRGRRARIGRRGTRRREN